MSDWGRLPDDIRHLLRQQEWDKPHHLRKRLSGERAFPLSLSLKAPSGKQALSNIQHFQDYMQAWKQCRLPGVIWEARQYRDLDIGAEKVPVRLCLSSMQALLAWLGAEAIARSQQWEQRMQPLLAYDESLYPVLIKQLARLEKLRLEEVALLVKLLPQLHAGLGQGGYLRALPLRGVDTKFIETQRVLLAALLNALHDNAIDNSGGLLAWLNCRPQPNNWLWVRPLCPHTQAALGGLPLLQLATETLLEYPLPCQRLLVVENLATGYALPTLANTIAVFGGGANLAWMQAKWLHDKVINYWGDLDTWGLKYLSDARGHQPHVNALMMDKATLLKHQSLMVQEDAPCDTMPAHLTLEEQQLFTDLRDAVYGDTRLEQERLAADEVLAALQALKTGD